MTAAFATVGLVLTAQAGTAHAVPQDFDVYSNNGSSHAWGYSTWGSAVYAHVRWKDTKTDNASAYVQFAAGTNSDGSGHYILKENYGGNGSIAPNATDYLTIKLTDQNITYYRVRACGGNWSSSVVDYNTCGPWATIGEAA